MALSIPTSPASAWSGHQLRSWFGRHPDHSLDIHPLASPQLLLPLHLSQEPLRQLVPVQPLRLPDQLQTSVQPPHSPRRFLT
jgi:hypothetical protein